MTNRRRTRMTACVVLIVLAGCAGKGSTTKPRAASSTRTGTMPAASRFVEVIDNPWMPWPRGTTWVFTGKTEDGTERTVVTVTDKTKVVQGVRTVVVHDVVHVDGKLLEDTDDWYAQDTAGNVWYFGEDTKEYDGAKVDTSGSWEAGVDGAKAGIVMLAEPAPGKAYRQEYDKGEAED